MAVLSTVPQLLLKERILIWLIINWSRLVQKKRRVLSQIFTKCANTGLFFDLATTILQKLFRFQQDSNSNRQSRRQARWPLDHGMCSIRIWVVRIFVFRARVLALNVLASLIAYHDKELWLIRRSCVQISNNVGIAFLCLLLWSPTFSILKTILNQIKAKNYARPQNLLHLKGPRPMVPFVCKI